MAIVQQTALANLKQAGLGEVVYVPGQHSFNARIASYWSLTAKLKPWAIVQPRTTEEVSKAVKALVKTPDCKFAVRSGGHMAWEGASNIAAGVTIDLGLMTATTFDKETGTASLQPGGRWVDVYAELEKQGVMVAGGREGLVGVGGLLIGGGKTYYTCRAGFACGEYPDQVVNYEVVLADGSVVNANKTTNPDLFLVLKGGSINFGIVTRFDMATFEARPIWDGSIVYQKDAVDPLIEAFVDFSRGLQRNPDSHILGMWTFTPQLMPDMFVNLVFTNLDGIEDCESSRKFLQIPGGKKNMKVTTISQKMVDFVVPSGREARLKNFRDTWFTTTFKLDARIMKKTAAEFEKLVDECKRLLPSDDYHISLVMQPLCAYFGQLSASRGGNMFGLERFSDDMVLLVAAVEVGTPELSAQVGRPKLAAAMHAIESYAKSVDGDAAFRYLNYCDRTQDPLATYGQKNIERMREAASKYDPAGVFQTRVPGGFKISSVKST